PSLGLHHDRRPGPFPDRDEAPRRRPVARLHGAVPAGHRAEAYGGGLADPAQRGRARRGTGRRLGRPAALGRGRRPGGAESAVAPEAGPAAADPEWDAVLAGTYGPADEATRAAAGVLVAAGAELRLENGDVI